MASPTQQTWVLVDFRQGISTRQDFRIPFSAVRGSRVHQSMNHLPPYHRKNWMQCCCLVTKSCLTLLQPHQLQPARLLYPWNSPGKNTGVGCYYIFQVIFLTQGLNPSLLHWQSDSLPLSHRESPNAVYHLVKLETTAATLNMGISYACTKSRWPQFCSTRITP